MSNTIKVYCLYVKLSLQRHLEDWKFKLPNGKLCYASASKGIELRWKIIERNRKEIRSVIEFDTNRTK